MDTDTQRAELQASMDGLNAAIDRRLAEIEVYRQVLKRVRGYLAVKIASCGCVMQSGNTTGQACDDCESAWDVYHAVNTALNARRAGEGE